MRLIKHDYFDEQMFKEGRRAIPTLDHQITEATDEVLPDLLGDTFNGLQKAAPQFTDAGTLTLQEILLREVMATKEFGNLREGCRGDPISTAIATDILGREMKPHLGEDMIKKLEDDAEAIKRLQDAQEYVRDTEAMEGDPDIDPEVLKRILKAAKEEEAEAAGTVGAIPVPDPTSEEVGEFRRAMRKVAGSAAAAVTDFQDSLEALGGANTSSLKDKLALANHVKRSSKLKRLVEISGRMRRVAVAKRASVIKEIPEEIVGIVLSDDLTRALPSEMVLLLDDETEMLFWQKFADAELMCYDLSGSEKLGEGPMIVLVDNSGSMTMEFPGSGGITREVWSKAVVLGYAAICEKEKRDLFVCHFADVGMLQSYKFPYGTAPHEVKRQELIACLEFFSGGENDIDGALLWAAKQLDPPEGKWGKADIVLITDAEHQFAPGFPQKWAKLKDEFKFTTYGVLIQSDPRWERNMLEVTDHAITVRNLASDEGAAIDMLFKT